MTRLGAKIPVEPLDGDRYARVEDQVMAAYRAMTMDPTPRTSRSPWRLAVPALAVACAAALLLFLGGRWLGGDAATHAPAGQRARITTDPSGATHYQLGDADIAVGAGTTIDVRLEPGGAGDTHEVHVDLLAGVIDCQVEPIPGRDPFIVHAAGIDITVVGTAFQVQRGDAVRVSVTRGKVRVDGPDGPVFLGPGDSWSSPVLLAEDRSGPAGAASRAGPGEADAHVPGQGGQGAETAGDHDDDPRVGDATGAGSGLGDRSGAAVVPELDRSGADLAERAPGRTSRGSDRSRDPATRPRSGHSRSKPSRTRGSHARELDAARPERGRPPADSQALSDAFALERDDPRAAVTRYGELALGRGADAEFALYSKAYLEHMRLGRSRAALATLGHYQKRFSRGARSEAATWLRIHILCQKPDLKECRAAAHGYLGQYKSGRHRDLAGRMISWGL